MFEPNKRKEICFADPEVTELFIDFQIIKQVSQVEPYKTLLKYQPETKDEIIALSREILGGKTIDTDAVLSLFPTPTEEELVLELEQTT